MSSVKKGDFIEIEFTGKANGEVFDSNIKEDLNKINPEAEPKKTVVVIGEKMIVPGLDKSFEGKDIGKAYDLEVSPEEGFGPRRKELVKIIPLRIFTDQKVNPRPGATFFLDNNFVKIIAVSGARVITDFNNPLAGKNLHYHFVIKRQITDVKEKAESLFEFYFRMIPPFEIQENVLVLKGEKMLKTLADIFSANFKKLLGMDLKFEEVTK